LLKRLIDYEYSVPVGASFVVQGQNPHLSARREKLLASRKHELHRWRLTLFRFWGVAENFTKGIVASEVCLLL